MRRGHVPAAGVGTYLYGRRVYDMMTYWETALKTPNQPEFIVPIAIGGGKRFLPDGVRLNLALIDHWSSYGGGVAARHAVLP